MNYGMAREHGLLAGKEITSGLLSVAKAINRLAAAVEKDRQADRQPVGLVIRAEQVTTGD